MVFKLYTEPKPKNIIMKFLQSISFVIILSFLFLASCSKDNVCISGEGDVTTQVLTIPNFTAISLEESATVIVQQGIIQEVRVVGHPNIVAKLKGDVSGGLWAIEFEDGCYDDYQLTIYITVPYLHKAILSGSGDISIYDFDNVSYLDLELPGSGNIEVRGFDDASRLNATISGSGNISGFGYWRKLKDLNVILSGSGNFVGFPLITEDCNVLLSGSGNIQVQATSRLDAKISGSGNVYYKGYPTINSSITGSGKIINWN